ncbi:MAG: AI-2E family transporter [Desulfuromonadales bacterium]|nr:AI-2E family transporter [Desulfuromonadales bacterium]
MDRNFFFALAAFAFLLFYLFMAWSVLAAFLESLIWAVVLALATYPLFRRLRARLHDNSHLAAVLLTPLVVLLVAVPLALMLFFLALEVDRLFELIQIRMAAGNFPTADGAPPVPGLTPLLEYLRPLLEGFDINLRETLSPALQNLVATLLERLQKILGGSALIALKIFVMIITLFFFYRDGERLLGVFWSAIPLPQAQKVELASITHKVLMAVIYGVFLTAAIQGALGFLGYLIAGLPSPALLGAATALAALVPMVGTALVWLPAGLYLLFAGKLFQGIFLLAWGLLVVGTSDNFIRPYFISGRGQVPFLTVLIGILGGLAAFGFVGIILGPIILTLFTPLLAMFRHLLPPGVASGAATDGGAEKKGRLHGPDS